VTVASSSLAAGEVKDPVIDFVLEEPVERVESFAEALEQGRIVIESTDARLKREFVHGPNSLTRMVAVLKSWREQGGSADLLARTIRGQLEVRRAVEDRGPKCELVWSGETLGGKGVRSTGSVVKEMLGHARRSVLVVSYSIWLGSGPAADVIVQLAGLSSAGVDITFILDRRYQDGWNVTQLKSAWPSGHRRPSIWSWQHESDSMAKLHAKVIVVDRRDVLITSANLTSHGIDKNLELGLRVLGQPAEDAAYHFERLIQDGEFDKIEW